jgi:hypothetical protein
MWCPLNKSSEKFARTGCGVMANEQAPPAGRYKEGKKLVKRFLKSSLCIFNAGIFRQTGATNYF